MQVDVYKSKRSAKYLIVPAGQVISQLVVNDADMKEVESFKRNVLVDEAKPLIGLDHKAAVAALAADGYYIQGVVAKTS